MERDQGLGWRECECVRHTLREERLMPCALVCLVRWERSQGVIVRGKTQPMNAEAVRDKWGQICDFTDATKPANIQGKAHTLLSSYPHTSYSSC